MRILLMVLLLVPFLATAVLAEDEPKVEKAEPREKPYGPPNPPWLTPGIAQDLMDWPHVAGLPATEEASAKDADAPTPVVVFMDGYGRLTLPGMELSFASEDPGVQDDNVVAFGSWLEQAVSARKHRSKDGTSSVRALLCIDPMAKWKYVQWVMQAFAGPKVKVPGVSFVVRRSETAGKPPVAKKGEPSRFGRIEVTFPRDAGRQGGLAVKPPPRVKLKLFRRDMYDPASAYTMIKVDNEKQTFALPKRWLGARREKAERKQQYDRVLAGVQQMVEARIKAQGVPAAKIQFEIVAPPPKGGHVPYGDVIRFVHMARQLGVTNIVFEGAATPLTARERAARNAAIEGRGR